MVRASSSNYFLRKAIPFAVTKNIVIAAYDAQRPNWSSEDAVVYWGRAIFQFASASTPVAQHRAGQVARFFGAGPDHHAVTILSPRK